MGLVPLAEGGSIDLDDGVLDESVCSYKFVVGGVVDLTDESQSKIRFVKCEKNQIKIRAQ